MLFICVAEGLDQSTHGHFCLPNPYSYLKKPYMRQYSPVYCPSILVINWHQLNTWSIRNKTFVTKCFSPVTTIVCNCEGYYSDRQINLNYFVGILFGMSLQFCANLGFLFKEVPFLDRYGAAARAGLLPWCAHSNCLLW